MTVNFSKDKFNLREKLKELERPSVDKLITKDENGAYIDIIRGNTKLESISSSVSGTAVDVFVYDTRKDSDGGAWRKRTQHTSWYNETLGTATRGSRKEFPAVAVLVLETGYLKIYDGDDPDLPMWMVLNATSSSLVRAPFASSVAMLNAKLVVTDGNNYAGSTIDFLLDDRDADRDLRQIGWNGNIADRNDTSKQGGFGTTILANQSANDVAMTVLPNAPIDDTTGLPIPTIAVATESGVSVVRDDGNVVDLTGSDTYIECNNVFFSDYGKLLYDTEDTSVVYEVDIPSSDISYGAYNSTSNGRVIYPTGTHGGFSSGQIRLLGRNMGDGGKLITKGAFAFDANGASEVINGLTLFDREESDPAFNSLLAFVASDYNTGWMHGDVKGAFLSDTDTTNVVGGNLVSNGTFDTDTTGWSASTSGNGTTISRHVDGSGNTSLRVVSDTSTYGSAVTQIALESNTTYVLSYYLRSTGGTTASFARTGYGTDPNAQYYTNIHSDNSATVSAQNTFTFTTGTISGTQYLKLASRNDGTDFRYDNISLCKAEQDRSVNNNGLQVFGTVTKTPVATGAELVGYSGFSASNYLQQPYNSDLAPGTAAYSVSCWFKTGTSSGDQYIFDRNGGGAGSRNLLLIMNTSAGNANKFQFWHRDNTGNVTDIHITDKTVTDNVWHQVVALNDGTNYRVYVDGEVSSVTSSQIRNVISDNNPPMFVGIRHTGGSTFMTGSMALFRYSKSAPSPEQIKKMYEDEKCLFHENAKTTLYGSSDAVTALAFDDTTNLLHVGTSAGRSEFQGLSRINNTTDAVTTAISASNGLVAEQ